MHPMLARELLKFFFNSSAADASQLIITSHESSLLDLDVLRRDEIWFCEKDALGQSHLYSLDEYKPRKDSDLREHYLQGRFGAVPFLADIDRLGSGKVPG
jgi:AAA15 family ATPase/GTPase